MWTTIWINGVAYPLTWTNLTNWTVAVPLPAGHESTRDSGG